MILLLAALLASPVLRAEDQAKAALQPGPPFELSTQLIYGNNKKAEKEDEVLSELLKRLKADFGYLNYEVRRSEKATLKFDETATQHLGDDLIFIVRNLGLYKGQRKVWLELWFRGKKICGAFSLFQKPAKPIFIKGPNTNEGTYIIVLTMVNGEKPAGN